MATALVGLVGLMLGALACARYLRVVPDKGFLDTRLQLMNSIMLPTFPSPRSIPAGAERVT